MSFVLVMLAFINGHAYPVPAWYFDSMDACQAHGKQMIANARNDPHFKADELVAMCFEVKK